jgi:hypothetical protein
VVKFKNPTNIKLHEINYATDKTVSYSQYSTWRNCQHQWYLNYALGNYVFSPSIHAVFGTAIHNTLQTYLSKVYNVSNKKADEEDWEAFFKTQFTEEYKKTLDQNKGIHFSSPDEMREFHQDGLEIIKAFKKDKVKWFGIRGWELIGIEIPILSKLTQKQNLFMKGFIDVVAYDKTYDTYYIYDFKTSTRGWGDKEKKNNTKLQQIILYKKYFSELYNIPLEKIEVEFIVLKRKLYENADFTIPRTQSVKPAAGKTKMKQAEDQFNEFLDTCFTEDGIYIHKEYPMNISKESCTWCPYNNGLCTKGESKTTFFS